MKTDFFESIVRINANIYDDFLQQIKVYQSEKKFVKNFQSITMQEETQFFSDGEESHSSGRILNLIEKSDLHQTDEKNSTEDYPQVLNVEDQAQFEPNQPDEQPQGVPRVTRVSNFIMPNMIREIKKCLSNAYFGPQDRTTAKLLERMFRNFQIKFQVWAFDAIMVCLIFIRDRTKLMSQNRYNFTIQTISSTLKRYKHKSLSNGTFDERQRNLIGTQYDLCINHLNFYERENLTFDSICKSEDDFREEFFSRMLTTRKNLRFKFLRIVENIEICLRGTKILDELMKE